MRKLLLAVQFVGLSIVCYSQSAPVQQINKLTAPEVALAPLKYLASDELKGRSPKRPEIDVAAGYIADLFTKAGVKPVEGMSDYYQSFELKGATAPKSGSLSVNGKTFEIGKDLIQLGGKDVAINAPIVFAGFGNKEDVDVKGKIVITYFGVDTSSLVSQGFGAIKEKQFELWKKGAVALVESFWQKDVPWAMVQSRFGQERYIQRQDSIPVFLINPDDSTFAQSLTSSPAASLTTSGNGVKVLPAKNVMGRVEGTDPKLKAQYLVLSAHYDHLGVAAEPKMTEGKMDSIFNGARDNAIGTTAVLNAARYFAKHPPKRSVMFILFTAEEMGLLGSRYFSEHPTLPFQKMVYNLNCDNGGYNDTSIATVIGLGRTSADDDIKKACDAFGLRAISDPVPELNLFDRSDNLNFAIKGVPAPTFGMGVTAFDSAVKRYYHQLGDEVESFNLPYALKYIRSYILTAKNIADNPLQPVWIKGDKYEAAWKKLYTSAE